MLRGISLMVSTDGLSNSYETDADFYSLLTDIYSIKDKEVQINLPNWLKEFSEKGSGDDITAAFLRNT